MPTKPRSPWSQGTIVTSDLSLRQDLLSLYRQGLDSKGCATVPGPNGPAFNPSCEIVRKHTCTAVAATIPLYLRIGAGTWPSN